jgi:hypothetical protein
MPLWPVTFARRLLRAYSRPPTIRHTSDLAGTLHRLRRERVRAEVRRWDSGMGARA